MAELSNGVNKKIIVRSILGILVLAFSFLSWSLLADAVNNGPDWIVKSVWCLVSFLFLGVSVGLAYLIEDGPVLFYGLPFLIVLPALVFLRDNLISAAVLAIAVLFLAMAAWRANFEKSLRIEFAASFILRKSLAPFVTALALIITVFFYWAPYAQSLGDSISIPRPLFDAIAKPAMDFSLAVSLPKGMTLKSLPPEFAAQQAALMDSLYSSVNDQLVAAGKVFKKWIPLGVSVSLFFSFKVIGFFLSWLMTLLAWLIFKIFLWSGVIKINKVAAEKEVVEI